MREELYKLQYGAYLFLASRDSGAEVGNRQTTVWFREKNHVGEDKQAQEGSSWRFLRDFYFEEADYAFVRAFCQQFASDESYREQALNGESHWARRNALFFRNLRPLFSASLSTMDDRYEQKARDFFYWLDRYTEQIVALPAYQRLQAIDNMHKPHIGEVDALILPAVELFNRVPGLQTRSSCQGVSGKVQFHNYSLLTVSQHEEFAYITFEPLSYFLHDSILALLTKFSSLVAARMPDKPVPALVLHSNGDNIRFRSEARELAQRLLTHVVRSGYRASDDMKMSNWQTVCYPAQQPDMTTPIGILPARLAWLCGAEHIEETLKYVFFLSNWTRATDDLYYDDRQGLYTIKTTLLQQAYLAGALQPVSYIDGTETFGKRFEHEFAVSNAAEIFLEHIMWLVKQQPVERTDHNDDNNDNNKAHCDRPARLARELFRHITGHDARTIEDIDMLVLTGIEQAIHARLDALMAAAYETRQSIEITDLEQLFIQPTDLLNLPWSYSASWSDLNEQQLRKLDPEGYSLITLQYKSATAAYLFYLPYRFTERFLAKDIREQLPHAIEKGRERASYCGRLLTVEESREYPPQEILRKLAIDATLLCPHKLAWKKDRRYHLLGS